MTVLVNISNAVAFVTGNARGISAMKERVRQATTASSPRT
jgi:hypothetical protein